MLNQDFLAVKLIQRLSMHWSLAVGSYLVGLNVELRLCSCTFRVVLSMLSFSVIDSASEARLSSGHEDQNLPLDLNS